VYFQGGKVVVQFCFDKVGSLELTMLLLGAGSTLGVVLLRKVSLKKPNDVGSTLGVVRLRKVSLKKPNDVGSTLGVVLLSTPQVDKFG
jgi:hypothetical protein